MPAHQQRHLTLLQESHSRFEDVSPAELRAERIRDPRPLPALEIPIGSTAAMCADAGLDEPKFTPFLSGLTIILTVGPPPWVRHPHRRLRRQMPA
jgi:hypothetical protein